MAFSVYATSNLFSVPSLHNLKPSCLFTFFSSSLPFPNRNPRTHRLPLSAAKSQTDPVQKRPSKKRKKKTKNGQSDDNPNALILSDAEIVEGLGVADDVDFDSNRNSLAYNRPSMPNPPAGFVVDDQGRAVMVSTKRIATIVDPTNNFP